MSTKNRRRRRRRKSSEEDKCNVPSTGYPKTIIKKSEFPNAGLGLFAAQFIKKHQIINEYRGCKLNESQYDKLKNKDYIWEVKDNSGKRVMFYLDGRLKKQNNPLRYVNGAKDDAQFQYINAFVFQRDGKLYYCALRNIRKGTEIIITYGDNYW